MVDNVNNITATEAFNCAGIFLFLISCYATNFEPSLAEGILNPPLSIQSLTALLALREELPAVDLTEDEVKILTPQILEQAERLL